MDDHRGRIRRCRAKRLENPGHGLKSAEGLPDVGVAIVRGVWDWPELDEAFRRIQGLVEATKPVEHSGTKGLISFRSLAFRNPLDHREALHAPLGFEEAVRNLINGLEPGGRVVARKPVDERDHLVGSADPEQDRSQQEERLGAPGLGGDPHLERCYRLRGRRERSAKRNGTATETVNVRGRALELRRETGRGSPEELERLGGITG